MTIMSVMIQSVTIRRVPKDSLGCNEKLAIIANSKSSSLKTDRDTWD